MSSWNICKMGARPQYQHCKSGLLSKDSKDSGLNRMATILQMPFSIGFPWMKIFECRLWYPHYPIYGMSTLVKVMAWYPRATSHYLNHCSLRFIMSYTMALGHHELKNYFLQRFIKHWTHWGTNEMLIWFDFADDIFKCISLYQGGDKPLPGPVVTKFFSIC